MVQCQVVLKSMSKKDFLSFADKSILIMMLKHLKKNEKMIHLRHLPMMVKSLLILDLESSISDQIAL